MDDPHHVDNKEQKHFKAVMKRRAKTEARWNTLVALHTTKESTVDQ
jgi:hypothetical protein